MHQNIWLSAAAEVVNMSSTATAASIYIILGATAFAGDRCLFPPTICIKDGQKAAVRLPEYI
jgi:hypothetical protein